MHSFFHYFQNPMGLHNDFGRLGEKMAADYLQEKGYTIRQKNYRYLKAEIDILAEKEGVLAVVEVKTRSSDNLQEIAETVNQKKIGLLTSAADHYVNEKELDLEVRFDIITLLKKGQGFQLEHIKDAFYHF